MAPAAAKIDFEVEVDPQSQWYGTLKIKNLRQNGHDKVTIQGFLGVVFKSPEVSAAIQVNPENLHEWDRYQGQDMFTESIDAGAIYVMAKLNFAGPYTFEAVEGFRWEINGNLTGDPERWKESFEVYADYLPSGTISVECAAAPESRLRDVQQVLRLQTDSSAIVLRVPPGKTTLCKVPALRYRVVPDELVNPLETVVAAAKVWPDQLVVQRDKTVSTTVRYGQVVHHLAANVKVDRIQAVSTEEFYIKVADSATGKTLGDTLSASGRTVKLRRLPWSAKVDVSIQVVVNNVRYRATKKGVVPKDDVVGVSIAQADVQEETVVWPTVNLDVDVTAVAELERTMAVRLLARAPHAEPVVYKGAVKAKSGSTTFAAVTPGDYAVQAVGFVDKWVVYAVETDPTLVVGPAGTSRLRLATRSGANLKVRGFPGFLSFGALTDLVDRTGQDFINARATSLFKYAGVDGAGDPDTYLPDDPATTITIQVAQKVQQALGEPVLPIMISYTCNLSLGNILEQLQKESAHKHSFGNFILSLKLAKQHGKPPVPAGYVVNPDFLGECQANNLDAGHVMPVKAPLKEALRYRGLPDDIPQTITDTLGGYVLAVNWLVRAVAPEVTFGWLVNLWGVGRSDWIYQKESPAVPAKQTAEYIQKLGVFNADYRPDFLAIDRYEADDFTARGYTKGYCYGPYEWRRFFDFSAALSLDLKVPVVPWQIPASRIPLVTDHVDDLEKEHWGTGGSYILGDAGVGSEIAHIHPKVLDIKPSPLTRANTVRDIFKRGEPFDLTQPAYLDFPLRGIPGVLLGGGQTTGIVSTIGMTGPWTQKKLKEYRLHALSLENSEGPRYDGPENDVDMEE
ncbi:hypothetical protein MAJ_05333, partial [Metarhizium majus ARSEF 297]